MSDPGEPARTPPSPCVRNCCLDHDRVCMGCHRTMDEICAWHEAPVEEKLAILERCEARRATGRSGSGP